MKHILILIFVTFYGCQNEYKIDGNYHLCNNGYYTEIFIKNDSIRAASDMNGSDLSKWQKMKIKNDTLYFMQFGHLRDSIKGKLKYIGNSKMEFHYFVGSMGYSFEGTEILNRIDHDLNFESIEEFWSGYQERKGLANCKVNPKKNAG
ncbi:hypothetical protein [Cellulophaga sp. Asnod2-G02]|uniref:hypothetical protein n=1 Tax=Cellulophaga sp. Asnod2-G02 TaxID=3160572 RepID=UPI00386E228D